MKSFAAPMFRYAYFALFAFAAVPVSACGQTSSSTASAKPAAVPDYAHESVVIDSMQTVYTYAADGTGTTDIATVIEIHDEAAIKEWSIVNVPFASSVEHVEITYIRVRHADGTVVETPAADAMQVPAPVTQQAPLYSDLMQEQIPVRGLREDDRLEYKVRLIRTHPETPKCFWGSETFFSLNSRVVVLKQTLELHVPAASAAQVWSPQHKPVVTTTPTEKVYRWESSQLVPVAGKNANELLRLDTSVRKDGEPSPPDVAWSNFKDWKEVGAWYRALEGTRIVPDADVRARAMELVAGKDGEEAKTRAIYGFVGPRVRYIGVDFGIGRLQPHEAAEVLRNQYGDCKDKATLQEAMLAAVGIRADTVLIGANQAFSPDLPSPIWFNHVITLAHVDGQPVWLDATAEIAPYRMLYSVIRGKHALVVPDTGDAYLATTPKEPPFPMTEDFKAVGTLDDQGTSVSKMELTLRSDSELIFRAAARSVSPGQWDELMQRISYAMSFAGKVAHTEFSRPDDTTSPFKLTYEYTREKNGDWDNLRIYPQLLPLNLFAIDEKDLPVLPIELGGPAVMTARSEMQLPKGWGATLPNAVHAKSSFAILDKTYEFKNGTLIVERKIQVLKDKVPAADWRDYQKWYKEADLEGGETYIQLTRPDAAYKPTRPDVPSTDLNPSMDDLNREATRLVGEAIKLEQAHVWDEAIKKLDTAKALNPNQPLLWSNYGFIAAQYGRMNEAIDDLNRELAKYPTEVETYIFLASLQMQVAKRDDAATTLHKALELHRTDPPTVRALVPLLILNNMSDEALGLVRSTVAANPDDLAVKSQMGSMLMELNKKEEAEPLLVAVLEKGDTAEKLNDAGYELADASLDLPLAEKSIRKSLDILRGQWNDDDAASRHTQLQRETLTVAAWDSLGWVLYREDNLAEAEAWVRAAWRAESTAEVGYHLAMILNDRGKRDEAINVLSLAKTSLHTHSKLPAKMDALEASLKKAGAKSMVKDAKAELQAERTFPVARIGTETGWASFDVALAPGGTEAVWAVGGDAAIKGLGASVKKLDLHAAIPPGSSERLLRRGLLSCHSRCEFVLLPLQQAAMDNGSN